MPETAIIQNPISQVLSSTGTTFADETKQKFLLAALGTIPWIGGFLSVLAGLNSDRERFENNLLLVKWINEHETKISKLQSSLSDIFTRFDSLGETISDRLQSEEYLDIVRKAFRVWDLADTDEKRKYAANIIVNASSTGLATDDVLRLFIEWLSKYNELHFKIISQIYNNEDITRYQIWVNIKGEELPREDSAEADLYRLIIRELTIGGVIRQGREVTPYGEFVRTRIRQRQGLTMESAFEDTKGYVLTKLGAQFVHYTMNENVARLENPSSNL